MRRRELLQVIGLCFVPLPGASVDPPRPGKIVLLHRAQPVFEDQIHFQLDSVMELELAGHTEVICIDGCALYRPGDATPFLQHFFEVMIIAPSCRLTLRCAVSSRDSKDDRAHDGPDVATEGHDPSQLGL